MWPVVLGLMIALAGGRGSTGSTASGIDFKAGFTRSVANVESAIPALMKEKPRQVLASPPDDAEVWYGLIMRRLPGETFRDTGHYVPFLARYVLGAPVSARCDSNLNGDLTDDPPVTLFDYPPVPGSRSFLVDLRWIAQSDSRSLPVDWKLRVVLEPRSGEAAAPLYHVQMVYAMTGEIEMEGQKHRAFLFDGNGDGRYSKDFGDGVFVDLNDDLRFDVSQASSEFGPFGAPFQMGHRLYETVSVDEEGAQLILREAGTVEPRDPARIGSPAPAFEYRDTGGGRTRLADYRGRVVLVYFWASWCGSCEHQAEELKRLHDAYEGAGLEILGVSFDTDRAAMEAFRSRHRQAWPTSFSGRMMWEDPVGRLYGVAGSGSLYLVDRRGNLEGIYTDLAKLAAKLEAMMPSRSATGG